ncbi:MAG TPA: PhzF family phenazine biosynthesis protein [Longimicrobiales bacterium]
MPIPIVQVDAFADRPYRGNPAAVCVLAEPRDDAWMQDVAREMNLSETAFLTPEADGFRLRWFTPAVEVDLCGHATLASAHVLWQDGHLAPTATARFHTRSGLLTAERDGDWIVLDFPAAPDTETDPPDGLARALGAAPRYVGRSRFDLIVELESEQAVRELDPDLGELRRVDARGVIVTARSERGEFDFISRFFAPRVGVDEDPVTGSAHCVLGPFWRRRLGKDHFLAYQASRRGGTVRVTVRGERVRLGGRAITTLRGELLV